MSYHVVFMTEAGRDTDDIEEYLSQFYTSTVRRFFLQLEKQIKSNCCHARQQYEYETTALEGKYNGKSEKQKKAKR